MLLGIKRCILRVIDHAGYVVIKVPDRDRRELLVRELGKCVAELEEGGAALAHKGPATDREFRPGHDIRSQKTSSIARVQPNGVLPSRREELTAVIPAHNRVGPCI